MTLIKNTRRFAAALLCLLLAGLCFPAAATASAADALDLSNPEVNEMFSKRDFSSEYAGFTTVTLADGASTADSRAVSISGDTVTIGQDGVYRLSGRLSDGQITVNAPEKAKVQLVLDGLDVTCSGSAAINIVNADKVFFTTAPGSSNSLRSTAELDGDVSGAIYSEVDISFNGSGSLSVVSDKGHGIATKDDLKICSGDYSISAAKRGLSGKDSIRIGGGSISISAEGDGLHTAHDKSEKGFVFISGGSLDISCTKDGIDATNYVRIIGGSVSITAGSDGINVAGAEDTGMQPDGSRFELAGGIVSILAAEDGIDSNGSISVSGGQLFISAAPRGGDGALDYGSSADISGGTVIAACSGDMAANFSAASNQGSILYRFEKPHAAGEEISLADSKGKVLLSFSPESDWQAVVLSSSDIIPGGSYTLTAGEESAAIEMDGSIYGNGFGFSFGPGGMMPPPGMPGEMPLPDMPEGMEPPEFPEGMEPPEFPGEGEKPHRPFAAGKKP